MAFRNHTKRQHLKPQEPQEPTEPQSAEKEPTLAEKLKQSLSGLPGLTSLGM